MKGTVTRVVDDGGQGRDARTFGFIRGEDGADRFFHKRDVVAPLMFGRHLEHKRVQFDPFEAPDGRLRGTNVRAGEPYDLDALLREAGL